MCEFLTQLNACCGCCSLQNGSKVICFLGVLVFVLFGVLDVLAIKDLADLNISRNVNAVVVYSVASLATLLVTGCGIMGVFQRNREFVLLFAWVMGFFGALMFALAVSKVIVYESYHSTQVDQFVSYTMAAQGIGLFIGSAIVLYSALVVYSYYREKRERSSSIEHARRMSYLRNLSASPPGAPPRSSLQADTPDKPPNTPLYKPPNTFLHKPLDRLETAAPKEQKRNKPKKEKKADKSRPHHPPPPAWAYPAAAVTYPATAPGPVFPTYQVVDSSISPEQTKHPIPLETTSPNNFGETQFPNDAAHVIRTSLDGAPLHTSNNDKNKLMSNPVHEEEYSRLNNLDGNIQPVGLSRYPTATTTGRGSARLSFDGRSHGPTSHRMSSREPDERRMSADITLHTMTPSKNEHLMRIGRFSDPTKTDENVLHGSFPDRLVSTDGVPYRVSADGTLKPVEGDGSSKWL